MEEQQVEEVISEPCVDFRSKTMVCKQNRSKEYYMFSWFKRCFDIIMSLIILVIMAIPMIFTSAAVKLTSKGPLIFKQKRMGKGMKPFTCLKFRTMTVNAPKNCATADLVDAHDYITKPGRFLRKSSLDELPQLINVIKGDMSLIGPRPVALCEEELIGKREVCGVYAVRPGMSGWAQVNGRDSVTIDDKVLYDAYYVDKYGVSMDAQIFFKTISYVFRKQGIIEGKVEE